MDTPTRRNGHRSGVVPSLVPTRLGRGLLVALLATLLCAGVSIPPGITEQEAIKLERLPPPALLAEGRVVESAPETLVLMAQAVDNESGALLVQERTSFDLAEADGYVYFVAEDHELSLHDGLRELRPGAWVEVAPMPGRAFEKWRVWGRYDDPVPGRRDRMSPRQPTVNHMGVRGWIYVWVISEPGRR